MSRWLLIAVLMGLFAGPLSACKDDSQANADDRERESDSKLRAARRACDAAEHAFLKLPLDHNSGHADALRSALTACGIACTEGVAESCETLDGLMQGTCQTMPEICAKLCEGKAGPIIQEAACKYVN